MKKFKFEMIDGLEVLFETELDYEFNYIKYNVISIKSNEPPKTTELRIGTFETNFKVGITEKTLQEITDIGYNVSSINTIIAGSKNKMRTAFLIYFDLSIHDYKYMKKLVENLQIKLDMV
jgi:hypothetical protein